MTTGNKLQQIAASNVGNGVASKATPGTNTANESQLIKAQIMAIVGSLETMDQERDHQKEMLEKLEAEHGISKKVARKVAKLVHKQNKEEFDEETAAVDALHARFFKQS